MAHLHIFQALKPAVSSTACSSPPGIKAGPAQPPCAQHLALLTVNQPAVSDAACRTPRPCSSPNHELGQALSSPGKLTGFYPFPTSRGRGCWVEEHPVQRASGRAAATQPAAGLTSVFHQFQEHPSALWKWHRCTRFPGCCGWLRSKGNHPETPPVPAAMGGCHQWVCEACVCQASTWQAG